MPLTYHIDKTNRITHVRSIEPVTLAEVIDHFHVLQRDPECPDRLDVLLHLSEQSSIPTKEHLG